MIPSNSDMSTPQPDKKPSPSGFPSPMEARFPPPIPQLNQNLNSPFKNPPLQSLNGFRADNSIPHLSSPSPDNGLRMPHLIPPSPSNGVRTTGMSFPDLSIPSSVNGVRTGSPIPHLSTPPGPPVFSSPLRPASIPFKTSPATPQSMAFSSGSSFSASSSPQYLPVPSLELQHQGSSDDAEDLKLVGQAPYILFSAHKVLKKKKQANVPSLGFGALVSPGIEISPGPQLTQRNPHRCQNCGSYANVYCKILLGSDQWQCIICGNLNGSGGEYIASSMDEICNFPELSSPMVDYVQTGNKKHGFIQVSDSRMSAPIILVIDESLDEPHLRHLQGSLHAFLDSIPPTTRIGIILYSRTVSIYDFSEESVASADVLPGEKSPAQESLKALIYGTGVYFAPLHASLPVAHTIFSSLRPYKLKIPEASRDRCLGTAVEVALAIIRGPSGEMSHGVIRRPGGNSRIIVCAGGPNTYGPGSVSSSFSHPNNSNIEMTAIKWMNHLGHIAHRQTTVVDIMCAGTCPVRVPVLEPLAKTSGGVLVLHDDFGEAFGVNLQRACTRSTGSFGLLEVRCSDDIIITQVVGPGEEAHIDSNESFKNDPSLSVQMFSVEEAQSFSLSMETQSDIKNKFVYFQFAVHFSNAYQAEISRVITVRLPAVDSVSEYLESVQVEVAAVLIAKRTVLQAKTSSDVANMQATLDERIKDVALKFGSQVPKSKLYKYPREISSLPEFLFHLKRGPLLGNIIGHEDERSVLRNLFLNASFDLSLRMVAPRCLMHMEGGSFEELPAYDLAMQTDAAVVLDHGTDVFIWLGARLSAEKGRTEASLAACRTLAEELTEFRFPAPRILAFKEGSSEARYFASRMIPAHKDPPYEQEARFPQLRTLTPLQRSRLKSSFLHFDDPSLCEWMRGLKVVVPESRR